MVIGQLTMQQLYILQCTFQFYNYTNSDQLRVKICLVMTLDILLYRRDFCFMRTPCSASGTTTSGTRASPKSGNSPSASEGSIEWVQIQDFCFMRTPCSASGTTTSGTRASPKPGNSPSASEGSIEWVQIRRP